MKKPKSMTPTQWQRYLDERNRQESKALCICGDILMGYMFINGAVREPFETVTLPWEGICVILLAGIAYELYFCVRGYQEEGNLGKQEMKISGIMILTGVGVVVSTRQMDVTAPVIILYVVVGTIGWFLRDTGKERMNPK